jgi:hypothetical protein
MDTTTATTTTCDRKGCTDKGAWVYTINTLYGVEEWTACQGHVREVREMHGNNIQHVRKAR